MTCVLMCQKYSGTQCIQSSIQRSGPTQERRAACGLGRWRSPRSRPPSEIMSKLPPLPRGMCSTGQDQHAGAPAISRAIPSAGAFGAGRAGWTLACTHCVYAFSASVDRSHRFRSGARERRTEGGARERCTEEGPRERRTETAHGNGLESGGPRPRASTRGVPCIGVPQRDSRIEGGRRGQAGRQGERKTVTHQVV